MFATVLCALESFAPLVLNTPTFDTSDIGFHFTAPFTCKQLTEIQSSCLFQVRIKNSTLQAFVAMFFHPQSSLPNLS